MANNSKFMLKKATRAVPPNWLKVKPDPTPAGKRDLRVAGDNAAGGFAVVNGKSLVRPVSRD